VFYMYESPFRGDQMVTLDRRGRVDLVSRFYVLKLSLDFRADDSPAILSLKVDPLMLITPVIVD